MVGAELSAAVAVGMGNSAGLDRGCDVLILDAATRQSLATVRSLGQAGLRAAAGECFAECNPLVPEPAVTFRSRYSARNLVLPSFAEDPGAFADAVVAFVRANATRVVIPAMDGSVAALVPRRAELAELGCTLALADDEVLAVANDKHHTLELARRLGIACPRTRRIASAADIPDVLATFEYPVVLKPTISWASEGGIRQQPVEAASQAEADQVARELLSAGVPVLVQQYATGRRESVVLFIENGDIRAVWAYCAHRTSPQLGGASALRESIQPPPDILDAATQLVKAIGLEGFCEVEFRRDAAGQALLMEINARLVGSVGAALWCGVDFPQMIWLWATGQPVPRLTGYRVGLRSRWLHGEMRWLRDNVRRAGRPDSVSVPKSIWLFGSEFARTRHYDCFSWRDLKPFAAELRNSAAVIRWSRKQEPGPARPL